MNAIPTKKERRNQGRSRDPAKGQSNSTRPDAPLRERGSKLLHRLKEPCGSIWRFLGKQKRDATRVVQIVFIVAAQSGPLASTVPCVLRLMSGRHSAGATPLNIASAGQGCTRQHDRGTSNRPPTIARASALRLVIGRRSPASPTLVGPFGLQPIPGVLVRVEGAGGGPAATARQG